MTMRSRGLLLLVLLCWAEKIASSAPNADPPAYPNKRNDIDLEKCTATTEGNNNVYQCSMAPECLGSAHYVKTSSTYARRTFPSLEAYRKDRVSAPESNINKEEGETRKDREDSDYWPCEYGFTMRRLLPNWWEFEVIRGNVYYGKKDGNTFGDSQVSDWLFQLNLQTTSKKTDKQYDTYRIYIMGGTINQTVEVEEEEVAGKKKEKEKKSYDFSTTRIDYTYDGKYIIFKLEAKNNVELKFAQGFFRGDKGKAFIDSGELRVKDLSPDLSGVIVRKDVFQKKYRGKMPRVAYDHNVHDFSQMCDSEIYKPFHGDKQIIAIEFAGNKLFHLVYLDDDNPVDLDLPEGYPKKQEDFIEITCQTLHYDCTYCDEPNWEVPSKPAGLSKMNFTKSHYDKCATLTCPNGLPMYYPQIGYIAREQPECTFDKKDGEFKWTITQRMENEAHRVRVPLKGGFCFKREDKECIALPFSMSSCPRWTEFGGCGRPIMNARLSALECPFTTTLHFSYSRQVPLLPVKSIRCDKTTGEYVVTMRNNDTYGDFDDETWIVCKEERYFPKYEKVPLKKRDPMLKAIVGGCVGASIFFGLVGVIAFFSITVIKIKSIVDKTRAAKAALAREAAELAAPPKEPKIPGPWGPAEGDDSRYPPMMREPPKKPPTRRLMPSEAAVRASEAQIATLIKVPEGARRRTQREFGNDDEQTCLEPDKEELAMLKEAERLAEATEDDDATGKEVKDIQKED